MFFASIIAYFYYKEQKQILNNKILLEMREFNYNFKNKEFKIDIIDPAEDKKYFILYVEPLDSVYTLFPISNIDEKILKVIYPFTKYEEQINSIKYKISLFYFLAAIFFILFSLGFSYYSLYPMRKAFSILDEFFKDIIHDLNTPVTAILLNSRLLGKKGSNEEIEKIVISAKRISELYKNFELISDNFVKKDKELLNLKPLIEERVEYFKKIYPLIKFELELEKREKNLDKNSFIRIIDNIISNSCKYNKTEGKVSIVLDKETLVIEDTGIGIKQPERVFERYYKETSRGIGIGMNIVKKLCEENNMGVRVLSKPGEGTKVVLTFLK